MTESGPEGEPEAFSILLALTPVGRQWTKRDALGLAKLGGAATFGPDLLQVRVTVHSMSMAEAVMEATRMVQTQLDEESRVLSVEGSACDEHDRQLTRTMFPRLAGVSEIATLLGVNRQRASALQRRRGFPAPVQVLASGPVWREADLTAFLETWQRRPGRPPKDSPDSLAS